MQNLLYTVVPKMQFMVQKDQIMLFLFEPPAMDLTSICVATLVPRSAPETYEMQALWEKNLSITHTALMEDFEL